MIQEKLFMALVQSNIIWEDPVANREKYNLLLNDSLKQADIIVLPEMFTTGFTMRSADLAETMFGESFIWMREKALSLKSVICGSLIIRENDKFYNRLIWINPDGEFDYYDKRHLFRMGKEDVFYSPGNKRLIIEYKGWKICPLICYDIRFPVWSRNKNDYDLMIYLANWPSSRQAVWDTLLKARAIENQSWLAGVNRIGQDGAGIDYVGGSCIINARGERVSETAGETEKIIFNALSYNELKHFREKFPVWRDADQFSVK
jgi:omega-amidase